VSESSSTTTSGLDEPLGPLDGQLGDGGVVVVGVVEGRGVDLARDGGPHLGDLLGPLSHEHDHEVHLGVVAGDPGGQSLQDHGLAGLGRRDDEAALSLADGREQVDDARAERLGLDGEPFGRVYGRQVSERGPPAPLRVAVDRLDAGELVACEGGDDVVARPQVELLDFLGKYAHVTRSRQVLGPDERGFFAYVQEAAHLPHGHVRTLFRNGVHRHGETPLGDAPDP
jgi:hypothetical protein